MGAPAPEPRYVIYDGEALDDLVYRVVDECPPSPNDFRSYVELGRTVQAYHFFRATGVSVHRTKEAARRAGQRYGLGARIAEVDIRDRRIFWAETGNEGHLTVWAPAAILAELVVSCG
jgi:hypothetical protein